MNIDSMIQGNPQALVTSYNGVLVADSLEVADRFGKRHTHVLRSIDDLINQLESQSTQNWADYFIPDDYQDNKNRTQRRFKLTRDGFSLLVMGFTGPAALHWKLLYIEAFNKMEQALRSNVDIRQLVTQITTDVLRTVLPDIRQAVEPPPEIEDGRVHNSRRLDFLYGNDEALPNFLTVYDIAGCTGIVVEVTLGTPKDDHHFTDLCDDCRLKFLKIAVEHLERKVAAEKEGLNNDGEETDV